MSSAKKSKPSTSENQESDEEEPQPPEDTASPMGGQHPETSSIGVTSSPPTATVSLDSIIGSSANPHNRAGDILGRTAAAAGTEYVHELTPSGTAKGSTEFYEMCTEILGFESMLEKMDLSKVFEEHSSRLVISSGRKTKMCRVTMGDECRPGVLPPLLSTLYCSGRPRFSLEKVTGGDGRLNIVMVDYKADLVGGGGDAVAMARDLQDDDANDENKEEEVTGVMMVAKAITGDHDQGGDNDVNQTVEKTDDENDNQEQEQE